MVKVKNRNNNVVSEFTTEEWEQVKNDPRYKNIFVEIPTLEALPEVKELRERQAVQAAQDAQVNNPLEDGAIPGKRIGKQPKNDNEEQPQ